MAFNGSGVYNLPSPAYPPVTGTKISSANYKTITTDIATALSLCLVRDGQAAMTGPLNMGAQKIQSIADGVNPQDAISKSQLDTVTNAEILATQTASRITGVDIGTVNAYVVNLTPVPTFPAAPAVLPPGMIFTVDGFTATNTGAATIAVNTAAAVPIKAVGGQALQGGELEINFGAVFRVNRAGTAVELLATTGGNLPVKDGTQARHAASYGQLVVAATPAGALIAFAGSTVPSGYLLANGAAVSRTTYAALFAALGTTWGAGNGSTTFNLPDSRGVMLRGLDAGRGLDTGRTLGSYQADDLASHAHGVSDHGHTHGVSDHGHVHGLNGQTIQGNQNMAPSALTDRNARPLGTATNISGSSIGIYVSGAGISINAHGGAETVSKNIAVNYIIKY